MLYKQRTETKVLCKICDVWYQNNKAQKQKHDTSQLHKENVAQALQAQRQKVPKIDLEPEKKIEW